MIMLLSGIRRVHIGYIPILPSCEKDKLQIQYNHRKYQLVCQGNPGAEENASWEEKGSCLCLKDI